MIGTAIHAAMRADEPMDRGDVDGRAVWLRIMKAMEEPLAMERPRVVRIGIPARVTTSWHAGHE